MTRYHSCLSIERPLKIENHRPGTRTGRCPVNELASSPAPILGYAQTLLVYTCYHAAKLSYVVICKKLLRLLYVLTGYESPASCPLTINSKRHRTAFALKLP